MLAHVDQMSAIFSSLLPDVQTRRFESIAKKILSLSKLFISTQLSLPLTHLIVSKHNWSACSLLWWHDRLKEQNWSSVLVHGRLKNRLTPICPTRGDLPFAFRLRAKKQQLGPGPPHAPQITKTHPNAPQQGVKCSRTFGQNLGGEKGEHSTSTCPSLVRKRGNSMKMRHEPRGTNVGKSTMKTGN